MRLGHTAPAAVKMRLGRKHVGSNVVQLPLEIVKAVVSSSVGMC
jgi:hypothetical protein